MKNYQKYSKGYFMPPFPCTDWASKEYVEKAPIWCSVDLRDGNQALITPMSLDEKIAYWKELVAVGFKEIEICFPAASETDYNFCRKLIADNLIPDDVTIQVLTQSREHIIKKTFEALKGCKNAVVHLYNSTSPAQREQVFSKTKEEIIEIAVFGAELCKKYRETTEGNFSFEYSPESFTATEPEYALEICNAVLDVWKPTENDKVIINLPVTVEESLPHVYASQVEYICKSIKYRENVIISLHPHNDRGTAIADCELGLLAGADRIEGTLFGNGERTGNVDIITLAMNMYSHGVDPKLDFSNLPKLTETYEEVTRMKVYERQPYSGALVFAAFSGSHQDAIAKGMKFREENETAFWNVPYLAIDPKDIGREYEGDVIRINSQSGKGGIGYLMQQTFGIILPIKMRESFGYVVKNVSDHAHKELSPNEIRDIFFERYVNVTGKIELSDYHFKRENKKFIVTADVCYNGKDTSVEAVGNGRLDAVSNAIKASTSIAYSIVSYEEHALEEGSKSNAMAYVSIETEKGIFWGVGVHTDIIEASVSALVSAINTSL